MMTINGKDKTATDKLTFYPEKTLLTTGNENVVYLLITAVANGKANIVIKDSNGAYASCKVTVTGAGIPAYACYAPTGKYPYQP